MNRLTILAISFCTLCSGCVVIPHPVPVDVEISAVGDIDGEALVSAGPRRTLEKIGAGMVEADGDMAIVPAIEFRDAAFPFGGWRLGMLLEPGAETILPADYLVLLRSGVRTEYEEDMGGYIPGFIGGSYGERSSAIEALVVDLGTRRPVAFLNVQATGTPMTLTWIVVTAVKHPMTETAVLEGLPEALSEAIRNVRPNGKLRVAVLAAEGWTPKVAINAE